MRDCRTTVYQNEALGHGLYYLRLQLPDAETTHWLKNSFLPGQFAMLSMPPSAGFLFRRPFTPFALTEQPENALAGDTLDFYYHVVGVGTEALSKAQAGEALDCLLPLGKPFNAHQVTENTLLLAGGVGIAPMTYYCQWAERQGLKAPRVIYGARSAERLFGHEQLVKAGAEVALATDDGSMGHCGTVLDVLQQQKAWLSASCEKVIVCGPNPMMAAVVRYLKQEHPGLPVYVSLENHMPCGTGACYGCVVASASSTQPKRVCWEGPTFLASDLLWHERGPSTDAWVMTAQSAQQTACAQEECSA